MLASGVAAIRALLPVDHHFLQLGAGNSGEIGRMGMGKKLPGKTRGGLQEISMVDEKGVPFLSDLGRPDDSIDNVGIDGGPKNPGLRAFPAQYGNNKMGEPAVAQENIAHIDSFGDGRLEPILLEIIHRL